MLGRDTGAFLAVYKHKAVDYTFSYLIKSMTNWFGFCAGSKRMQCLQQGSLSGKVDQVQGISLQTNSASVIRPLLIHSAGMLQVKQL